MQFTPVRCITIHRQKHMSTEVKIVKVTPDPLLCPLCGKPNSCINLGAQDIEKTCWCNDPTIKFPEALLSKIPPELRGKACVCKTCVLNFHQQQEIK